MYGQDIAEGSPPKGGGREVAMVDGDNLVEKRRSMKFPRDV